MSYFRKNVRAISVIWILSSACGLDDSQDSQSIRFLAPKTITNRIAIAENPDYKISGQIGINLTAANA
jgi:hypothetical protein